jgi:hypothetical protein
MASSPVLGGLRGEQISGSAGPSTTPLRRLMLDSDAQHTQFQQSDQNQVSANDIV